MIRSHALERRGLCRVVLDNTSHAKQYALTPMGLLVRDAARAVLAR